MKKTLLVLALVSIILSGCTTGPVKKADESGAPDITDTNVMFQNEKVGDYIDGLNYEGIAVNQNECVPSDDEVEKEYKSRLDSYDVLIDDSAVQNGDIVSIVFQGREGEALVDGGMKSGYEVEVGSGTFVSAFEEKLVGMKKGTNPSFEIEIDGKKITYTVTVEYIKRKPSYTDEAQRVKEISGDENATVESYKAFVKQLLTEEKVKEVIWSKIIDSATLKKTPHDFINYVVSTRYDYMEECAKAEGKELSVYFAEIYGQDSDIDKVLTEQAEKYCKEEIVIYYIADRLFGNSLNEEKKNEGLNLLAQKYGYTVDELKAVYSEETLNKAIKAELVKKTCYDRASITK